MTRAVASSKGPPTPPWLDDRAVLERYHCSQSKTDVFRLRAMVDRKNVALHLGRTHTMTVHCTRPRAEPPYVSTCGLNLCALPSGCDCRAAQVFRAFE